MSLPKRNANSNDPVSHPYSEDKSSANLYRISAWLDWRLSDPDLDADLRTIIELEAVETRSLGDLNLALEQMDGDDLEAKMKVPEQRATLRRLSLRWMRCQAALIDATTQHLDHSAPTNGH
jgi:hypothetical protein